MFSLRRIERLLAGQTGSRSRSRNDADHGWVLPRPLRKPVRFLGRFAQGDITPPRFVVLALSAVYLGVFATYGAVLGGHMPEIAQAVTARTGFAVDEISVSGNKEVSEIDVLDQLELTGWTSLVGFDASAARDRIAKLSWVEGASVRKVYPDKIQVDLVEKVPFAVWQHDGQLSVIEPSGKIISSFSGRSGSSLPMIVGLGAPEAGANFVTMTRKYPELTDRVRNYVRVADRRWDLWLDNGIVVKLPEHGADLAMRRLIELDQSDRILSRDIAVIDMRLNDRITLALTEQGLEARAKALKERDAMRKSKSGARL